MKTLNVLSIGKIASRTNRLIVVSSAKYQLEMLLIDAMLAHAQQTKGLAKKCTMTTEC